MCGAILGDIVGSPYEFDRNNYKAHVEQKFDYDLSRTCDEIRLTYRHVVKISADTS